MIIYSWQEIPNFSSYDHFNNFKIWMNSQIENGQAKEVEIIRRYSGSTSREEHWYKQMSSGVVWQLVEPDPPFEGFFSPIPKNISNWNIQQFKTQIEFNEFIMWMENQIKLGVAEEIKHDNFSATNIHANENIRFFKHKESDEIWQLINPTPPFYGSFWLISED